MDDWPHRDASRFVEVDGLRCHVQVFGSGPDLLLLHGTGASTHSFRELAPLLAARHRVIVPDLPGHARTATPSARHMTVDGMARVMAALVGALGAEPVLAVGHSAGAAVLVRMALDRRAAFAGIVGLNAALVPLGGLLKVLSPMAKVLASAPGVPRLVSGLAQDTRAVQRLVDSTGSTLDAEGARLYANLVRDRAHVAGALAMMAAWDLDRTWAQSPSLAIPLLLVVGSNDRTVPPAQSRAIARQVPGTSVEVIDGLGHLAHEEAPGEVARRIEAFHARLGAAGSPPSRG